MFGSDPDMKFPQKQSSLLTQDVTGSKNAYEDALGYRQVDPSAPQVTRDARPIAGMVSRPDGGQGAPWAHGSNYEEKRGNKFQLGGSGNNHPTMKCAGGRTTMESRGNMSNNMAFVMGVPEDGPVQPPMEPIREDPVPQHQP